MYKPIVSHATLDRGALLPARVFFSQNVERFRAYGAKARGRCPFHVSSSRGGRSFSTPLSIDLDRGLFHCHSCNAGGDIISFVMLRDNCDFTNAAKTLGVWRPVDQAEAEAYRRAREARDVHQERKDRDFYEFVQVLLKEMEIYESVRDLAFRRRDDHLQSLAEQLITAVGADYIRLKAGAL